MSKGSYMSTKSNEAAIVRLEQRVRELEMNASKLLGKILVLQEEIELLDARIAAACGMLNLE